jgi:hypothetical protein
MVKKEGRNKKAVKDRAYSPGLEHYTGPPASPHHGSSTKHHHRALQALSVAAQPAPHDFPAPGVCAAFLHADRHGKLPLKGKYSLFGACRLADMRMGQLVTLELPEDEVTFKAKFVPD